MYDDLGIRVRGKFVSPGLKPCADLLMVLDDAVVHDRDAARHMGVRVAFQRCAVGRPSRVGDAESTAHALRLHQPFELCDTPCAAHSLKRAVQDRDTG